MNPKLDDYFSSLKKWKEELSKLRSIILDTGLTEELKWNSPCYTYEGRNILIIGSFKNYFTLSFFKGALLKDSDNILIKPGENTQAVRIIRFSKLMELLDLKASIKNYISEAIKIEKKGLKYEFQKQDDTDFVPELVESLIKNSQLKKAFEALTPGRQRAYNLIISQAKQSHTRIQRVNKYTPRILAGKGINDCICGKSKRMPGCDGSHKYYDKDIRPFP